VTEIEPALQKKSKIFGYTSLMLLCPVRDCHKPLAREERRLVCPGRHSFDIARSGYVNLLQPQERRSKQPGDTTAVVAARRRLHDRGVTGPLLDGIAETIAASSSDVALDAGCGEGFYPGELARRTGWDGHGIDISVPAIEAAAKRFPECEWIVGNADRFVPYADESFSIVLSITGRMNVTEFRRVLRRSGRLLVGIAAPDDLIELRGKGRDRVTRTVETFAPAFRVAGHRRISHSADLDEAAVRDVLAAVYRPLRSKSAEAMRLTFSLDLLVFQPV
jgi:23S rRNA (guanine745-N1)-methyltransferase